MSRALVLLFPLLFYSISSAPSTTFDRSECIPLFSKIEDITKVLKRDNPQSIENFDKYCTSIVPCLDFVSNDVAKKAKALCHTTLYIYKDPCVLKLVADNSTCFQTWTPLQEITDRSVLSDFKKLQVLIREMCENIQGKDGCMKKEAIEKCGEEKWKEVDERVTALVRVSTQC